MFNYNSLFETASDYLAYLDLGDGEVFGQPPLLGKREFSLFQDEPTDLRSHLRPRYEEF
jgi:hypothetical protein